MRRRRFVQLAATAVALSPLDRLALGARSGPLPESSVVTLQALAPIVLPASLGRRAIRLVTDRFLARLQEHRAGVAMDYGYGRFVLRTTPDSPAPRYVEQLAALEQAAQPKASSFGRLPADGKRALLERALNDAKVESLPDIPDGRHVVSDLMAFYFQSSEANDACYRAHIGRETCRPLHAVTVRPKPLG
jgi:hypothetical protein